jgi:hypothetical protein
MTCTIGRTTMKHLTTCLAAVLLTSSALIAPAIAHEGHGLPGVAHWHPTDVIGYVLAAGIGAVLWFTRRK